MSYKAIAMNPPFSEDWTVTKDILYPPFEHTPPKSKADYAFIIKAFRKLDDDGKMAVVLPHGVLFRGASEGKIRKTLLENGYIDAVIGLPEKLFFGTGIPTVILVLRKQAKSKNVFFIDASREFEKGKNQNNLTDEHIEKIIETYQNVDEIDKYSRLVAYDEILENDFNLNIPRYIDTFEEPELIDIAALYAEMQETDKEIEKVNNELAGMVRELDGDVEFVNVLKGIFKQEVE